MHTGSYRPLKMNINLPTKGVDGVFDLYMYPASIPSRAVLMTAKQLKIPVNIKTVDLLKGEHMQTEFLKMNPLHTVPIIDDKGFYLFESRAIMRYLVNKFTPESTLYPKDPKKRAEVDKMLEFDHGVFFAALKDYFVPLYISGVQPTPEKQVSYVSALKLLDNFLSKRTYVAGQYMTLADLSIFSGITYTEIIDYDYSDYPNIQKWMTKMKQDLPYHKEVNVDSMNGFKDFAMKNVNKI